MFKKFRRDPYNVELRVFTTAFKIINTVKGENKQLPKGPSCNFRFYVISEVLKGVVLPK